MSWWTSSPRWEVRHSETAYIYLKNACDAVCYRLFNAVSLCRLLASRKQLPDNYSRICDVQPSCGFERWNANYVDTTTDTQSRPQRMVLSYAHNGFGNQLWEHSFAYMVSQQLNASLAVQLIPDKYRLLGEMPQNTHEGIIFVVVLRTA
jgi:hypothetical protein